MSNDAADNPYAPEHRVKAFLDGCAYILLRDNSEGTLTTYKEKMNGTREVPVSSCPDYFEDMLYSNRKPPDEERGSARDTQFANMLERMDQQKSRLSNRKKKADWPATRFHRVEEIKTELPGGEFTFCRVDTKNRFEFDGVYYVIDKSQKAYQPKRTKEGSLYDMDQIVVVRTPDRKLHFFDQKLRPIDPDLIHF